MRPLILDALQLLGRTGLCRIVSIFWGFYEEKRTKDVTKASLAQAETYYENFMSGIICKCDEKMEIRD